MPERREDRRWRTTLKRRGNLRKETRTFLTRPLQDGGEGQGSLQGLLWAAAAKAAVLFQVNRHRDECVPSKKGLLQCSADDTYEHTAHKRGGTKRHFLRPQVGSVSRPCFLSPQGLSGRGSYLSGSSAKKSPSAGLEASPASGHTP